MSALLADGIYQACEQAVDAELSRRQITLAPAKRESLIRRVYFRTTLQILADDLAAERAEKQAASRERSS